MATQTHGYYGLSGSSRTADFGLAANMTLPMVTAVDDTADPANATMPTEQTSKKSKKTAKFAVEADNPQESQPKQEAVRSPVTGKPSWRTRLSGLFRRNSKKDKSFEEAGDTPAVQEGPELKTEASAMPSMTVDDLEVDKRKAKGKRKKTKRPRSTAFDKSSKEGYLPSLSPDLTEGSSDFLKLALKPKGSSSNFEAIKVTLRRKSDGFGIHLSGGLPPISVIFVQPGSEAESARIMVGDIVTEVNGHDCLKGVGISRIMELKSLIQQSSIDAGEEDVDDGAWEKIKEKQEELESDNSGEGEITRIDDTTDSEEEQKTPKEDTPKEVTKVTVGPKSSTPKKTSKKNKKTPKASNKHDDLSAISSETPEDEHLDMPPKSPSKLLELSPRDSPNLVTVGVIKKTKRKKKAEASDKDASQKSEENDSSIVESPVHKPSAKGDSHTPELHQSQSKETPKKAKKKKTKLPEGQFPPRSEVYKVELSQPVESPDGPTVETHAEDKHATPKRPKEPSLQSEATPHSEGRKKKGVKSKGKSKKKKTRATPSIPDDQEHPKERQLSPSSSGSKLKPNTTFEEHQDLEWVDSGELESPQRNLGRRKSVDVANLPEGVDGELSQPITSEKRSTSYHDLDKEDRKMFREELRQASKSEYDIAQSQGTGGPKVDIDPNVRVKKSGVVIGKRKTNERPSIFETDGGEAEKEREESEVADPKKKKGKRKYQRKLAMEIDITAVPKTSPSLGLKHGHERLDVVSRSLSKRRPASLRKTLLLDSKKEVLMGKERVDLSEQGDGKPLRRQTMPEKSLKKPNTLDTTSEEDINNIDEPVSRPRKQSIAEYMESLQRTKYSSLTRPPPSAEPDILREEQPPQLPVTVRESQGTASPSFAAARKLFQQNGNVRGSQQDTKTSVPNTNTVLPSQSEATKAEAKDTGPVPKPGTPETNQEQPKNGGRRSKTVDQPVKKLGIASELARPAWVSIAQKKHDRTSVLYGEEDSPVKELPTKTTPTSQSEKPTAPRSTKAPLTNGVVTKRQDNSIPKMGTVRDRLAMFQTNK